MGNGVTMAAGFALASEGLNFSLFFATLMGMSLIIASACVFNNVIDREADQKMERTKNRALATGVISLKAALTFATILGIAGSVSLLLFSSPVALAIALLGFCVYVTLYSVYKYRTVHATLIGSIAGAVPPVIGYAAAANRLDLCSVVLFAMMVFWQMPHFYAIAIYRSDDYAAAKIPVLPLKKGLQATKIQMVFYVGLFIAAASLLPVLGFVRPMFLFASTMLGAGWLWLALQGFSVQNNRRWARKMFIFSLIVVMGISLAISFF